MNRKNHYRNLDKWRKACNRTRKRNYNKTSFAKNHNQRWTLQEIEIVMKHEITDFEISQKIGRSVQAIQVKRWEMNKKVGYEAY